MKKRLLRTAAYLLVLMMTVTNLPMAFAAPAEYGTLQITQTNPRFEGLEAPLQITQVAPLYFSDGEEPTYYTDPADAAAVIRDAMEARQESFTVGYSVPEKVPKGKEEKDAWFNGIAFDLLLGKAFEETENATEGDSLRFCWHKVNMRIQYISYSDHTDILFPYNFIYFTNAAQEAELTEAVDELVEEFAFTDQTTEREKIDAIYGWLCANVTYDHTNPDDYLLKFSAYAAMIDKTAVCEGYAVLFYRLAEEVGLDARVITGVAGRNNEAHGWNIVRLDDSYYYLDATWDAGKEPQNYAYYLRGKSNFEGHINGEQYKTEAFRARYPIAAGCSHECSWERMMNDEYHWYQCTVCGAVEEEEKHSGGIATCKEKANCVVCGIAYGNLAKHTYDNACDSLCNVCTAFRLASHQYANATCTAPKTCKACGATSSSALGHNYSSATCTAPKTCTVCGATSGSALGHNYANATCTAPKTCNVCGATSGSKLDHSYSNACDTSCNVCGATRAITHSYGEYVYNNDATSQKDGTQTRTCSVCKKTETITATGTKLQNPFKDVKAKEYYVEPVLWAVGKKITNGMSATSFAPNNNCTRGQIVTFLWRAAGEPEPKTTQNPFKDVKSEDYYYKAVLWAVENGITNGMGEGTFAPNKTCTRGQVATFLWRAKNKPAAANSKNPFADLKNGEYYYDAVLWAVENGITNGMGDGTFASNKTCTRGQIVTFLYRAYK